jgi:hypothetical protein
MHLWFNFVALGGDCNCWFLITLGDCRHLDGWCWIDWWGDLVIVSAPNQGEFVRGHCGSSAECLIPTLVDCSCRWVTALVCWFLRCLAGRGLRASTEEPPRCWSTQRGLACRQASEPREKNKLCHLLSSGALDWLIDIYIVGIIYLVIGNIIYSSPLV